MNIIENIIKKSNERRLERILGEVDKTLMDKWSLIGKVPLDQVLASFANEDIFEFLRGDEKLLNFVRFKIAMILVDKGVFSFPETNIYRFLGPTKEENEEMQAAYDSIDGNLKSIFDYLDRKINFLEEGKDVFDFGNYCLYCYDAPIENLPSELEGTTILHLSDIHFRKRNCKAVKRITRIKEYIKENCIEKPDYVFITGDFILKKKENWNDEALRCIQNLYPDALRAFVLGGHDYQSRINYELSEALVEAGFIDMTNKKIDLEKGSNISLYGLDDDTHGIVEMFPPDKIEVNNTNILITHNLDSFPGDYPYLFSLILSGHTHSGEFNLGLFDGIDYLKFSGDYSNKNGHSKGWKNLNARTLSYISPGLQSHYPFLSLLRNKTTDKPGATLIRLKSYSLEDFLNERYQQVLTNL